MWGRREKIDKNSLLVCRIIGGFALGVNGVKGSHDVMLTPLRPICLLADTEQRECVRY